MDDRRAPSARYRRCVVEVKDKVETRQESPHFRALHALPTPVDDAHLEDPALATRAEVLLDDGDDVPRRERMQVQLAGDRILERVVAHGAMVPTDRYGDHRDT